MKKIAILLITLFLLSTTVVYAENAIEYTGGVILRSFPRESVARASADNLINVAYISPNVPYLLVGEKVYWNLSIEGGIEPYTIHLTLWHQDPDVTLNWFNFVDEISIGASKSFSYTHQKEGRYFWQATITDAVGQVLVFQSRPVEAAVLRNETDSSTVVGKVNWIVSELISDNMSEYTRAKVLHDWLIDHADYDYTYQNYTAAGVLLYGSGVCDSYARAYELLLTAAGVENVCVTGTGNGGSHAWNLVKIDGVWYHVDCTWDDTSGNRYGYFLLSDEAMMANDHQWNLEGTLGMLVPETEGGEYSADEDERTNMAPPAYDIAFSTTEELTDKFLQLLSISKLDEVYIYPTGDISFGFSEFSAWCNSASYQLEGGYISSYGISSDGSRSIRITWFSESDDPYIRLKAEKIELHAGMTHKIGIYQLYIPDQIPPVWSSSNEKVVMVDSEGCITAIGTGTAVITATLSNGYSASIEVEVYEDYVPFFNLSVTENEAGPEITWTGIPGVTEYQLYKRIQNQDYLLTTVASNNATVDNRTLPADEICKIYVVANRIVDGKTVLTYTSEMLNYGRFKVSYQCNLPAGMTVIEESAFQNCGIGNVYIPEGVLCIGEQAFNGCTNTQAVYIPGSVCEIGANAFDSSLQFAFVEENSYAHRYFEEHYPSVLLYFN